MSQSNHVSLSDHAIESLELPAVLEVVASHCINEGAGPAIRASRLSTDPHDIEEALGEIDEMRRYRAVVSDIPVADTSCRRSIDRAVERVEPLAEVDLLEVAAAERNGRSLHRTFRKTAEEYPLLDRIVSRIVPQGDLVEQIDAAIDSEGRVRDSASPKLQEVRKNIAKAKDRIRNEADRLAKRIGKNAYATLLGARHVVLAPKEACRRRDGIAHSTSHSKESLYFEPFSLVELNNSLEALVNDEIAEIARVLRELSAEVVRRSDLLTANLDAFENLDALRAKAIFSGSFDCITPGFSSDGALRLNAARHPLLVLSFRGAGRENEIVPLDLELPRDERVMVITGPNAGGKTVTLKTVGLLSLMFQCGLQVPCAQGSEFPVFKYIFADIGDEQSIESSLSTFTSHLRHLDTMCRHAEESTLCLIDEIGDGTDPDEGASLANAALEKLLRKSAAVIATTHYGKVKIFALQTPGILNASMAFADDQNRPLFRLLRGLAGRSRGIDTARRCGFDPEVVKRAEHYLGEEAFRLERLLSELESSHIAVEDEREALAKQSESLQRVIERYTEKEKELDSTRAAQREKARVEAREILLNARREIERIVKEIRESGARKERIREGHQRIRTLLREVSKEKKARRVVSVSVGDRVCLNPTGKPEGTVIEIHNDSATVEIDGKRIKIKKENLYELGGEAESAPPGVSWDVQFEPLETSVLDVRGMESEGALESVDRFIDRAVLSGVHEVTIIHGVGEGILLNAIRSLLSNDSRVKVVRGGTFAEGGSGVSIIRLN
ncbi:MAG: hypothetical protein GTO51_01865 [Candidatus Latescibacteria bacterium]|nr:hypothetical protein [Candidatus Latescibacterota bacterium]NIM22170.1 hypothetical protein [Candidatus Latescibacterota bacterium]NIM64720.1 hypothetical protein [Candidatus Latescibacterota bacterium]NIO01230.1 hypothetical protein [Candidatus Latescibacterota bacterium]NIO27615.1 hypothetical protein [Candidatus Latescibacterota bacterium]